VSVVCPEPVVVAFRRRVAVVSQLVVVRVRPLRVAAVPRQPVVSGAQKRCRRVSLTTPRRVRKSTKMPLVQQQNRPQAQVVVQVPGMAAGCPRVT
jgi:hypothetical protein